MNEKSEKFVPHTEGLRSHNTAMYPPRNPHTFWVSGNVFIFNLTIPVVGYLVTNLGKSNPCLQIGFINLPNALRASLSL